MFLKLERKGNVGSCPVEYKKCPCHPVDFRKLPYTLSLSCHQLMWYATNKLEMAHVAMLIFGEEGHLGYTRGIK